MSLHDHLTAAQLEAIVATVIEGLPASGIPDHLHGGLVRYLCQGILPGSFLQAVLCNDLREAVHRAASPNAIGSLRWLIVFLELYAPPAAWGSRHAVLAWTTTPDRLEV